MCFTYRNSQLLSQSKTQKHLLTTENNKNDIPFFLNKLKLGNKIKLYPLQQPKLCLSNAEQRGADLPKLVLFKSLLTIHMLLN